jgi:hypothetical protein
LSNIAAFDSKQLYQLKHELTFVADHEQKQVKEEFYIDTKQLGWP